MRRSTASMHFVSGVSGGTEHARAASVDHRDAFGQPVLWMATSDGLTDDDAVFIFSGRDSDYNWAFTAPGFYEIDVVASAYLPGQSSPTCSSAVTYAFGVENR